MGGKANPRRANGYRRDQARRRVAARGEPCWICGAPIDYGLPAGDPWAFEADEVVPVSLGGSPFDPGNMRAAHRLCNEKRGNRPAYAAPDPRGWLPVRTTTDW